MTDNNMDVKVIVATHKEYRMPDDEMYLPVYVGAIRDEADGNKRLKSYTRDDAGDNISDYNPGFCELTGLYWLWKNRHADYKGLVQYRRHFKGNHGSGGFSSILRREDIQPDLGQIKVFVPKKRKYYIESLYSHYAHTHYIVQLDATREIIERIYPDYIADYDNVIKRTSGYMFNMMILESELFDDYCSWLFDILFELKNELGVRTFSGDQEDGPELTDFQARFYGRISEIIFNVWLENKLRNNTINSKEIKELGYINLEGESWPKKIASFFFAKFFGKKYDASF